MDQRTDNRVQCVGDGEHDGDEVEHERECYIELDGAHHALGERDEVRQLRDFSSTSAISAVSTAMSLSTPADIGGLERGRVVHAVADHADLIARGLIGADVDELFDARAGAGDGQLFEKTAELHDERDLTRGKVFADADRRDQRERDEHVCLDVERRDKADDGL